MTPGRSSLPAGVRRAFRLALGRRRIDADVDDEVAFHLDMRASELIAQGWTPEAAREEAQRRFGNLRQWSTAMAMVDRAHTGRRQRSEWLAGIMRDIRYTSRALRRQPLFTAGVMATLALGIGANATMFGIVDHLLLRPPAHVVDPSSVRRFNSVRIDDSGADLTESVFSYASFAVLRATSRSFADIAAWGRASPQPLGRGTGAQEIQVGDATASLFPTLGVRPRIGRFFTEAEDSPPSGSNVAVLGHELWRTTFGGDPAVLGRSITVSGRDYQVIGVAPDGFAGIGLERVDLWLPMTTSSSRFISRMTAGAPWWEARNVEWLEIFGRLRPGVTAGQAEAELAILFPRVLGSGPGAMPPDHLERSRWRILLSPVQAERGPGRSASTPVTIWLLGVSVFVLIIACANVTNLLLARAARRRREIAVRLAMGAGRGRLVRQLLIESLLLAAAGGLAGLLVAEWGGGFVRTVLLPSVAWDDTITDSRVLLFTCVVVVLTGVLAGIVPAIQASRPDLTGALKSGMREGGGRRARTRTALLVTQAALSVMLLVGAGLFVRSLGNASRVALGLEPERVLRLGVDLRGAGYTRAESDMVYQQILARLRAVPAVSSAALASTIPFYSRITTELRVPGRDSTPRMPGGRPLFNAVSPGYFATVGTRLVRGRDIADADRTGAEPVAIVSQTTARTLWPGGEALGQCVRLAASDTVPCKTIIGIVDDVRWTNIQEAPSLQVYVPIAQQREAPGLLVRPSGDAAAAIEAVQRVVYEVAPRVTLARVVPIATYVDRQLRPWRLGASMFTAFGVLALVIAAVGLYSMLAYTVALRAHELGVRVALGASVADVLRLVVGDGMRVTGVGIALGVVGALLLSPRLERLLYGVTGRDPLVVGGVVIALLAVALVASLEPAMRAARADPSVALRND